MNEGGQPFVAEPAPGFAELRAAFDAGDPEGCRKVLKAHPKLADEEAPEGLPYLLAALHRESHGQAEGLSAVFASAGATVDILAAAALGDRDCVRHFLEVDPSLIKARDPWQMQPLHWAAHCGHAALVTDLLDRGADVNADADSWTALHLAVELEHPEAARVLIRRGANLEARLDSDHDRMTPLEMARAWDLPAMVEFLEGFS